LAALISTFDGTTANILSMRFGDDASPQRDLPAQAMTGRVLAAVLAFRMMRKNIKLRADS
jgi:hypothetical protein